MNKKELNYKILYLLEKNPNFTQRVISENLNISLGATNYAIKALIERGFLKISNFKKSNNKKGYLYLVTLSGIAQKTSLALQFIDLKRKEHKIIQDEISKALRDLEKPK